MARSFTMGLKTKVYIFYFKRRQCQPDREAPELLSGLKCYERKRGGYSSLLSEVCLATRLNRLASHLHFFKSAKDSLHYPGLRPYYREEVLCLKTTYPVGSMLEAPEFSRISSPALLRDWIGGLFRKRRHRGEGNFRLIRAGARLRQGFRNRFVPGGG